ncbi:MAG: N-acetyltransferase, partial [Chloroflexi bacterium]
EIEPLLQAPPMNLPHWPEACVTLKDGRILYIREAKLEEVPEMLGYMEKVMKVQKDFYDIVGVRVYGEILGWLRKRLKDPFHLVGLINGEWVGLANGRVMTEEIAVSLHTMTFTRRGRVGWAMYYAKTYYALEILKMKEWWSTFESYNGWRMAGIEMAQPTKPWPQYQHELGGARVYYLDQSLWQNVKSFSAQMVGSDFNFNVPDEVRKANENFHAPATVDL